MVAEVIYSDMDNNQAPKDLSLVQYTQSVWQKSVQSIPTSWGGNLAMMDWAHIEAPTLYRLVCQLQKFEENLYSPSLLWTCMSAVERLFHKV